MSSFTQRWAGLMGTIVTVRAETEMGYHSESKPNERTALRRAKAKPRPGWVIGVRHLSEGMREPESHFRSYYEPGDYEPAYLGVTRRVPVVLVSYWPSLKPVAVQEEDLALGSAMGLPYPPQATTTEDYEYSEGGP